jgi:hypothetical protein
MRDMVGLLLTIAPSKPFSSQLDFPYHHFVQSSSEPCHHVSVEATIAFVLVLGNQIEIT